MIHFFEDIYDTIFGNDRLAELRQYASRYGYQYRKRLHFGRDIDIDLKPFNIFDKKNTKSLRGVLQKHEESLATQVMVMDYIYYGNGSTEKTTVAILRCDGLDVPYTMIRPVSTLKKIGSFFKLIKEDEVIPGFSDKYDVYADEEDPDQLVLTKSLVEIFLDYPGLTMEAEGCYLTVYRYNKIASIMQLQNFINTALDTADILLNDCSHEIV